MIYSLTSRFLLVLLTLPMFLQAQGLYDIPTVRSIYIDFENPNYDAILKAGWLQESGHRELATLTMDGTTYDSVAIRYKGNSTFAVPRDQNNPKIPLNIDMDDYIDQQDLLGFDKIKLANGFFDPTMVREVLAYTIYRRYMPASLANHMKVYVEGNYLGMYVNTESVNKDFLKKHFDYKKGVLFKCDPQAQFGSNDPWLEPDLKWYGPDSATYYSRYDLKTDNGWTELLHLIDVLNHDPDSLPTVLNIDRAMWYLAVSTVIANYDTYNGVYIHNYYLYKHKNGLFQMIPWDLSESFIGAISGASGLSNQQLYRWDPFVATKGLPLMNVIKSNSVYNKQYIAHIRTILNEIMDKDSLSTVIGDLQNKIAFDMAADNNAFMGFGNTYFYSNVNQDLNAPFLRVAGILPTVQGRSAYLLSHPEVSKVPPAIPSVSRSSLFPGTGEDITVRATVSNAQFVELMVTKSEYASHFQSIHMRDDGMHDDGAAGDGVYGAKVPFKAMGDEVKYYVRAQNQDAMQLNPQRAEYVFYEYTVGAPQTITSPPALQLTISPNPSGGIFKVSWEGLPFWQVEEAAVYDLQGKRLLTFSIPAPQHQLAIDLTSFPQGVYLLQMGNVVEKLVTRE